MDTKWLRNSFVYLIILVAIIALVFGVFQPGGSGRDQTLSLSEVVQRLKRGEVKTLEVSDDKVTVQFTTGGVSSLARRSDSSQAGGTMWW